MISKLMGYFDVGPFESKLAQVSKSNKSKGIVLNENNQIDQKELMKYYYSSPEASRLYIKVSFLFMTNSKIYEGHKGKTLVPPYFIKYCNHIPLNIAKNILETILEEENIANPEIEHVMDNFKNLIFSDMYFRIKEESIYSKKFWMENIGLDWKFDADPDDNNIIRFDFFVKFVIGYFFDRTRSYIEKLYSSL